MVLMLGMQKSRGKGSARLPNPRTGIWIGQSQVQDCADTGFVSHANASPRGIARHRYRQCPFVLQPLWCFPKTTRKGTLWFTRKGSGEVAPKGADWRRLPLFWLHPGALCRSIGGTYWSKMGLYAATRTPFHLPGLSLQDSRIQKPSAPG